MLPSLHQWDKIERHTLAPGYHARMIHTPTMTFMLVDADAGSPLQEHKHTHEQVTSLLSGSFELTVGGILHRMKAGDVVLIPSNTPHSAKALTDCKILDVFNPRREDYAQGDYSVVAQRA